MTARGIRRTPTAKGNRKGNGEQQRQKTDPCTSKGRPPGKAKEEAGPSPIRALRVWAQDDSVKQRQRQEQRHRRKETAESQRQKTDPYTSKGRAPEKPALEAQLPPEAMRITASRNSTRKELSWTEIGCGLKYFNTWNCIPCPWFYGRGQKRLLRRLHHGRLCTAAGRWFAWDAGREGLWLGLEL
jgi:hypothetical protein